jgi:polar amino acid transport system ATP-binding protein
MSVAVTVRDVSKRFGKLVTLDKVFLEVRRGDVVGICGPSGAGKTTLLRCIAGLEKPDSGTVVIHSNNDDKDADFHVGMAFQRPYLWPHMTVMGNVTLAQKVVMHRNNVEAEKRAQELLDEFHVLDKKDQLPEVLSGGQMQRVSLARMMSIDPDLLLLDEVTAGLDEELVSGLQDIIKRLAHSGRTLIVVSHDLDFLAQISCSTYWLEHGTLRAVE